MKNLSAEQIERLYEFTRQHYVEYYDVQTELVDHLASAIEKHWQENPELEFEMLLQQEFKKFGIFGFGDVVEERQQAMQKRYFKLVKKEVFQFLKLLKVIIVAFLIWLLSFLLLQKEIGVLIIGGIVFAELIWMFYELIRLQKIQKQKKKEKGRIYLLEEILLKTGDVGSLGFMPFYWFWTIEKSFSYQYVAIFLGFLITFSFVLHYIVFKILLAKKEEILHSVYPEMKLEKV
ncbi:hypothetical protein [Mesonia aestuariivivens]|uniref:Uncharacterized protein n=1 Tax=Mesonia aestuariivivens TaxID=2796128 RepID=A0ABS6VX46_9FLAO|nr:hypothetical protein [Mesonia aestuariivivens]MBW2960183.1 hypothetical protein [Mesonia aestuariivivens]